MAGGEFQSSRLRHFQFQCLRHPRGWRHDGRRGLRSGFACGTFEALESLLDLRQQPSDVGRSRRVVFQRRCDDAFQGLRLERHARHGRQRFGHAGPWLREFSQFEGPADAHRGGQPHRLWIAPQTGFLRSAWRATGRSRNQIGNTKLWLVGGSADLAKSNKTNLTFDGAGEFYPNQYRGRNVHFGVREHAMGAIVNGMTLSKLRAFSATFFNFSDYMRPSMRLGALMEIPAIYIFTHDSIGVGEDGPTHQPIEQLASLRAMPNMLVLRPGDANEVVEAYKVILQHTHGPS